MVTDRTQVHPILLRALARVVFPAQLPPDKMIITSPYKNITLPIAGRGWVQRVSGCSHEPLIPTIAPMMTAKIAMMVTNVSITVPFSSSL